MKKLWIHSYPKCPQGRWLLDCAEYAGWSNLRYAQLFEGTLFWLAVRLLRKWSSHRTNASDKRSSWIKVFLYLREIICCVYSLEAPRWSTPNEFPHRIFIEVQDKYQYFLNWKKETIKKKNKKNTPHQELWHAHLRSTIRVCVALRKHAYSNILKISPPKNL